jgi:GTP-binding protein
LRNEVSGAPYDAVPLTLEGGRGGDGCVSFRREKYIAKGGPTGGDGGKGGDVYLVASANVHGFFSLRGRKSLKARNGEQGGSNRRFGKAGPDLEIEVPIGTELRDVKSGILLKDLVEDQQRVRVVTGGIGGRGNAKFARSTRQTPRYAEEGKAGESRAVVLTLKLIADAGLVGLPNAGKSTLLARLSKSRTQIGAHRFTTLSPHLGVVELSPSQRITFADLPGLIEGAHTGRGLGDHFLKHVERTQVLVHIVAYDPLEDAPPADQAYRTVRQELASYSPELAEKPEIVALSKCDLPGWEAALNSLAQESDADVTPFSAVSGKGLDALIQRVARALGAAEDDEDDW